MASQGSWGDWQVRQIAENMAEKRPKREWFEGDGLNDKGYLTSLKSWSHITARQLFSMELEERQLIIFIHHLGIEHVGVETFDPQQQGRYSQQSSYKPSEEYTKK
ncbi:MAG: hypothetical protein QGH83_07265 [Candidatus Pacebacteria bacterium]|jgi:hypothetical protein|nr:hypothetical protein [Candidatus Paceibacterota bacterium]